MPVGVRGRFTAVPLIPFAGFDNATFHLVRGGFQNNHPGDLNLIVQATHALHLMGNDFLGDLLEVVGRQAARAPPR
jgi:hypothetical protein